jgi:hypothetical protein
LWGVRVVGGIALAAVLYAPMIIVSALLGQAFLGAWWFGVAIVALWSVTMLALARIARHPEWQDDLPGWLGAAICVRAESGAETVPADQTEAASYPV